MKFVIFSNCTIPGFGVRGPVMTPRAYDLHQVLKWLSVGLDVREVMEDGSYRKLTFNDEKLNAEVGKLIEAAREYKEEREKLKVKKNEKKEYKQTVGIFPKEDVKPIKKKEKVKKEVVKEEAKEQKEPEVNFPIDNLEKPE